VEAAGMAPSANNCQPWQFIIVDEPSLVTQVAEQTFDTLVSFNKFTTGAAAMAVVLAEKPNFITQVGNAVKQLPYRYMDLGMAVENFCLQAVQEGIGTCVLGWFYDKAIKKLLSIPKTKKIALIISIGYPADPAIREKKRKTITEILSINQFGEGK